MSSTVEVVFQSRKRKSILKSGFVLLPFTHIFNRTFNPNFNRIYNRQNNNYNHNYSDSNSGSSMGNTNDISSVRFDDEFNEEVVPENVFDSSSNTSVYSHNINDNNIINNGGNNDNNGSNNDNLIVLMWMLFGGSNPQLCLQSFSYHHSSTSNHSNGNASDTTHFNASDVTSSDHVTNSDSTTNDNDDNDRSSSNNNVNDNIVTQLIIELPKESNHRVHSIMIESTIPLVLLLSLDNGEKCLRVNLVNYFRNGRFPSKVSSKMNPMMSVPRPHTDNDKKRVIDANDVRSSNRVSSSITSSSSIDVDRREVDEMSAASQTTRHSATAVIETSNNTFDDVVGEAITTENGVKSREESRTNRSDNVTGVRKAENLSAKPRLSLFAMAKQRYEVVSMPSLKVTDEVRASKDGTGSDSGAQSSPNAQVSFRSKKSLPAVDSALLSSNATPLLDDCSVAHPPEDFSLVSVDNPRTYTRSDADQLWRDNGDDDEEEEKNDDRGSFAVSESRDVDVVHSTTATSHCVSDPRHIKVETQENGLKQLPESSRVAGVITLQQLLSISQLVSLSGGSKKPSDLTHTRRASVSSLIRVYDAILPRNELDSPTRSANCCPKEECSMLMCVGYDDGVLRICNFLRGPTVATSQPIGKETDLFCDFNDLEIRVCNRPIIRIDQLRVMPDRRVHAADDVQVAHFSSLQDDGDDDKCVAVGTNPPSKPISYICAVIESTNGVHVVCFVRDELKSVDSSDIWRDCGSSDDEEADEAPQFEESDNSSKGKSDQRLVWHPIVNECVARSESDRNLNCKPVRAPCVFQSSRVVSTIEYYAHQLIKVSKSKDTSIYTSKMHSSHCSSSFQLMAALECEAGHANRLHLFRIELKSDSRMPQDERLLVQSFCWLDLGLLLKLQTTHDVEERVELVRNVDNFIICSTGGGRERSQSDGNAGKKSPHCRVFIIQADNYSLDVLRVLVMPEQVLGLDLAISTTIQLLSSSSFIVVISGAVVMVTVPKFASSADLSNRLNVPELHKTSIVGRTGGASRSNSMPKCHLKLSFQSNNLMTEDIDQDHPMDQSVIGVEKIRLFLSSRFMRAHYRDYILHEIVPDLSLNDGRESLELWLANSHPLNRFSNNSSSTLQRLFLHLMFRLLVLLSRRIRFADTTVLPELTVQDSMAQLSLSDQVRKFLSNTCELSNLQKAPGDTESGIDLQLHSPSCSTTEDSSTIVECKANDPNLMLVPISTAVLCIISAIKEFIADFNSANRARHIQTSLSLVDEVVLLIDSWQQRMYPLRGNCDSTSFESPSYDTRYSLELWRQATNMIVDTLSKCKQDMAQSSSSSLIPIYSALHSSAVLDLSLAIRASRVMSINQHPVEGADSESKATEIARIWHQEYSVTNQQCIQVIEEFLRKLTQVEETAINPSSKVTGRRTSSNTKPVRWSVDLVQKYYQVCAALGIPLTLIELGWKNLFANWPKSSPVRILAAKSLLYLRKSSAIDTSTTQTTTATATNSTSFVMSNSFLMTMLAEISE